MYEPLRRSLRIVRPGTTAPSLLYKATELVGSFEIGASDLKQKKWM